jgi:drug/metabolite transporter (DMT)-like permease
MEGGALAGNIIALFSGLAFAGVALCMRAQKGESTTESILLGNILSFVVCIILNTQFMMHDSSGIVNPALSIVNPASSIVNPALGILILGIFQLGVSYILYSWAMKHVTAIEAVLLTTLEPILNPVWVALFYGEVPSTMAIIGGVIVVAGVVARNFAYERAHDHTAHPGADR